MTLLLALLGPTLAAVPTWDANHLDAGEAPLPADLDLRVDPDGRLHLEGVEVPFTLGATVPPELVAAIRAGLPAADVRARLSIDPGAPPSAARLAIDALRASGVPWGLAEGSSAPPPVAPAAKPGTEAFARCYRARLSVLPELAGEVVLELVVAADGAVREASVASSEIDDPKLLDCLLRTARQVRFPAPRGGAAVVARYPFVFATE